MSTGQVSTIQITGTADSVVTLAEAKVHLGITIDTANDALITDQIAASIELAEAYLSRDILAKQRELAFVTSGSQINLYFPPIASVDSVVVDGTTFVEDEGYRLRGSSVNPIVFLSDAQTVAFGDEVGPYNNVVVTYTTEGLSNAVIKQGVLYLLHCLYDGYESDIWKKTLAPYKLVTLS